MNQLTKTIKHKLALLKLAERLGNVQLACKTMDCSRDSYYRYRKLYKQGGERALQEVSHKKPIENNRVEPQVERAVVAMAVEFPEYGQHRVANELIRQGILVSGSGVRSIWLRHNLETLEKRLVALEIKAAQRGHVITETQLQLLEKERERRKAQGELEAQYPGYLGVQDTYYVGHVLNIGNIYQQTFIDAYSLLAVVNLYLDKNSLISINFLADHVLPLFDAPSLPLLRILTDRGAEYYGKTKANTYQFYLNLENIEHFQTRSYNAQTNRVCERFNKIMKNECYHAAFRSMVFQQLKNIQQYVDRWIVFYNHERVNTERYCYGRAPWQTWHDGKVLAIAAKDQQQAHC